MKHRVLVVVLVAALLINLCMPVGAVGEEETMEPLGCYTDPSLMEGRYDTLIQNRAHMVQQTLGMESPSIMPGFATWDLIPSTGDVKLLVLPIAYPDYPEYKEAYDPEAFTQGMFARYDPKLEMYEQSVRGFFERSSYGKLDITGTVLPVYDAPLPSTAYESDPGSVMGASEARQKMLSDALQYYVDQGLDLSAFDNNDNGAVDALVIRSLRKADASTLDWWSVIAGLNDAEIGGYRFGAYAQVVEVGANEGCEVYIHEICHLLGLHDNYKKGSNKLDDLLNEVMAGGFYMNAYYKYLLGWIDPVIITNLDAVGTVELAPIERYTDYSSEAPKAVVLIPEAHSFPFSEYYVAEYRAGGIKGHPQGNLIFDTTPGLVIWHCNTYKQSIYAHPYETPDNYLRPVYKSATAQYSTKDVYLAGDEFTSDSTPSSNFYGDMYTGAYLKVDAITPEKAVLQVGFRKPNLLPGPVLTITPPSVPAVNRYGRVSFSVTTTVGGEKIEISVEQAVRMISTVTTGTVSELSASGSASKNPHTITYGEYAHAGEIFQITGDGKIYLDIPAGVVQYNGKASPAIQSDFVYVDNTPPVISLLGANPQTIQRGDPYLELSAEVADNLDPEIGSKLRIDHSQVDTAELGTYTVFYSAVDHATNAAEVKERTVIVQPPVQETLSMTAVDSKTYGDLPFQLSTTGGSGVGAVTFHIQSGQDVLRIDGNTATILQAGTAEIYATKAADENYAAATSEPITVTVRQRDIKNVTVEDIPAGTYTGAAHTPTPTVSDGAITITVSDYDTSYVDNINAGTATIILTAKGNYTGTNFTPFTIDKADPSYSVPMNLAATYGDTLADIALPGGFNWEEPLTTVVGTAGAQTHTVTYTPNDTENYNVVSGIGINMTVDKAKLVVVAENKNVVYNSAIPTLTYAISGFASGESEDVISGTPNLSTSYTPGGASGNYPITITAGTLTATNYSFDFVNGTLSVGLSTQEKLSIDPHQTKVYGDSPFQLATTGGSGAGTVTFHTQSGQDVLRIDGNTATILQAGTAEIYATKAADENYAATTSEPITITVNQAVLKITAKSYTVTQGDTLPTFGFDVAGLHEPDQLLTAPKLICAATDSATVERYVITPKEANAGSNYTITYVSGMLTIKPSSGGGGGGGGGGSPAPTPTQSPPPEPSQAPGITVTLPKGESSTQVKVPTPEKPSAGTVAVLVKPDGTREVVKSSLLTDDGLLFTATTEGTYELVDNATPFTDVKDGAWYKDAVDYASARELFGGVGDGSTFAPLDPMTRGMVLTVLYRYEGAAVTTQDTAWYAPGRAWAMTQGLSDGTDMEQSVTREQLATLLYRYAGQPSAGGSLTAFPDRAEVSPYALDAMGWAVDRGLLTGKVDGTLAPQGPASRAEVAATLMRFIQVGPRTP